MRKLFLIAILGLLFTACNKEQPQTRELKTCETVYEKVLVIDADPEAFEHIKDMFRIYTKDSINNMVTIERKDSTRTAPVMIDHKDKKVPGIKVNDAAFAYSKKLRNRNEKKLGDNSSIVITERDKMSLRDFLCDDQYLVAKNAFDEVLSSREQKCDTENVPIVNPCDECSSCSFWGSIPNWLKYTVIGLVIGLLVTVASLLILALLKGLWRIFSGKKSENNTSRTDKTVLQSHSSHAKCTCGKKESGCTCNNSHQTNDKCCYVDALAREARKAGLGGKYAKVSIRIRGNDQDMKLSINKNGIE